MSDNSTTTSSDEPAGVLQCGSTNNADTFFGLRVASVFIIMATSMFGALFPTIAGSSKLLRVPPPVFEFVKFFGSGVIIATAFIHLLAPAFDELTSDCLTGTWTEYDWAPATAMLSVLILFHLELVAFRWGSAKLEALGITAHDHHGHGLGHRASQTSLRAADQNEIAERQSSSGDDEEAGKEGKITSAVSEVPVKKNPFDSVLAQIVAVAILEFGIVFHSVIIGLTLAVDPDFKVLFIVIIFHQMFEGLGLGTRLATLPLPAKYNWCKYVGGLLYGVTTPIGIAAGLGIRSTYNPGSTTATIVSGLLDATSAGILLYTGLVELLAHEFIFNPNMREISNAKLAFNCISLLAGTGIMALLGRWA